MISVSFEWAESCSVRFKVKGHSGLKPKGEDIVCAAVSALTQTFAAGSEQFLSAVCKGKIVQGNADILIKVPENKSDELKLLTNVFKHGFRKIAESYPEQLTLI